MALMNLVSTVNHTLDHEMARDERVVVFGEDVGVEGGVFRATVGLQKKYGPDRCFDTPLAEGAIVGMAVGMAINGLRPVAEIQFSGFMYPIQSDRVSRGPDAEPHSGQAHPSPGYPHAPWWGH